MILSRAVKITGQEEVFIGDSLFQIKSGNYWANVGHREHLGYIGGPPASMKSTMLRYIAASGTPGVEPFGLRLNLEGQRVVWFDGEQPRDIVVDSVNHISLLSGKSSVDYMDMYELNGILLPMDRRREMWRIIREELAPRMDTALIIIDGLSNFINNIMDFADIEDFMNKLTTTAKRLKCMIIVLSHIAKTDGGGSKLFGAGGTRLDQLASWGLHMSAQGPYFAMTHAKGRYGFIAPKFFTFGKEKNILIEQNYWPY